MAELISLGRATRKPVLAWLHLARVFARLEQAHQTLLRRHEMSVAQFDVLSHVCADPGLSQQELADRLLVTKGNVCGMLDRLGESGWVERRQAVDDRRVNRLYPTEGGRQRFRCVAPKLEGAIAEQLGILSAEELVALRNLLGKLDRGLRARGEGGEAEKNVG